VRRRSRVGILKRAWGAAGDGLLTAARIAERPRKFVYVNLGKDEDLSSTEHQAAIAGVRMRRRGLFRRTSASPSQNKVTQPERGLKWTGKKPTSGWLSASSA